MCQSPSQSPSASGRSGATSPPGAVSAPTAVGFAQAFFRSRGGGGKSAARSIFDLLVPYTTPPGKPSCRPSCRPVWPVATARGMPLCDSGRVAGAFCGAGRTQGRLCGGALCGGGKCKAAFFALKVRSDCTGRLKPETPPKLIFPPAVDNYEKLPLGSPSGRFLGFLEELPAGNNSEKPDHRAVHERAGVDSKSPATGVSRARLIGDARP
jgi:hypothetical protein